MAETNYNRELSGMNRRASARELIRLSMEEEDDYDLAAMGISDGFRPTDNAPTGRSRVPSHPSHRERRSTPPPRPSSLTKPRNLDTFVLRHDGAMGVSNRPTTVASSSGAGSISRSSSVSTDMPIIRAESPYQGPVGPSHPYHMYPQNTRLARTASVATTSTNPGLLDRPYTGPHMPTHPYGMYLQNTVPETESIHDSVPVSSIPVGFPGHGGEYRRRLGPDGEEAADIIGPLGHTEQLPPYTKYPNEALARKAAPVLPPLSGAGGIGRATRNPEFASREDLNTPLSRQSNRSLISDSDHQINVAAPTVSEKPPDKRWKRIALTKVWGIVPVWVIILVAIIFLFFILTLCIILKIFVHHVSPTQKTSPDMSPSPTIYTTVTTTYDAKSLSAVPTGTPVALPTGKYFLSLAAPSVSQSACLNTYSLYSAWSCALPPDSIKVSILEDAGNPSTGCYNITMNSNDVPSYFYGTQPPIIPSEQVLHLVSDTQNPQGGPAWFFEFPYDKLVVVPEDQLSSPSSVKRDGFELREEEKDFTRKGVAQAYDKPWFCYWNNTILETFIYVNKTSSSGAQVASASIAITSTQYIRGPTKTTMAASAETSSSSYGYSDPDMLNGYPKVVKVEERRVPGISQQPYCMKMEIQYDGSARPAQDSDGNQIYFQLNETEPFIPLSSVKRSLSDDIVARDVELIQRQSTKVCRCVWQAS